MAALAEAGDRGRRREPRPGPRGEARRSTATRFAGTSSATCRAEQGEDRQPDLRARPLARLRVGRAAARDPGARRGQPLGRADEVGRRRPRSSTRSLALYADVRGLMTMPPLADDPEASRPYFRRLRELAEEHGLRELSMGTSQDYRVAVEEGATLHPRRARSSGRTLERNSTAERCPLAFPRSHGLRRSLEPHARLLRHRRGGRRTGTRTATPRTRSSSGRTATARTCAGCPRRRRGDYDDWTDSDAGRAARPGRSAAASRAAREQAAPLPRAPRGRAEPERQGPPRPPAQLQRRPADRRQVQGRRSR